MLKNHRGFSMIELLIVLAILAAFLALAVPSFSSWTRNAKVKNASDSINNGIQLARMEAIKRNTAVTFWLVGLTNVNSMDDSCAKSASGISWVVSLDDPAGECSTAPSDSTAPKIIQAHPGGDGNSAVTVQAVDQNNAAAYCITFTGLGQVRATCSDSSNPIAQIQASYPGDSAVRSQQVRITSGGSVRTCDPAVSSTSDPRKC